MSVGSDLPNGKAVQRARVLVGRVPQWARALTAKRKIFAPFTKWPSVHKTALNEVGYSTAPPELSLAAMPGTDVVVAAMAVAPREPHGLDSARRHASSRFPF